MVLSPEILVKGMGMRDPRAAIRVMIALLIALLARPSSAADDSTEHFERRVRPLLVEHCYSCHSVESGKRKGGLLLDRREGWQVGGDSGPAIIPGEPDASLLIRAVRRTSDELSMPPDDPLVPTDVAILERWIRDGAPDPRTGEESRPTTDYGAAREHWSFLPIADPVPPDLAGEGNALDPIDRFIRSKLEGAGLRSSPAADRVTLIRRANFSLIGLPPAPEEVAAFLADGTPGAFERVVDRLLASPHFGERWGRSWLDLARYADSNGLDENLAYGSAWRYRDYVVRAWNADAPFDRFLLEQLAGDLLPARKDERADLDRIIATGFFSLGPKMLAEQDKEKLAMDIVDEQLDVALQAFVGMTVGCARCHDHKFDPIPTQDYYALAGIFRSTQTMQHFDHVSAWREAEVATEGERSARQEWEEQKRAHGAAHAALEGELSRALEGSWRRRVDAALIRSAASLESLVYLEAEAAVVTNLKADDRQWGEPGVKVLHTHLPGTQFAEWEVTPPRPGKYRLSIRYAAMESRPMRLTLDETVIAESALAAKTGGWLPPDQRWEEVGEFDLGEGRHLLRAEREGPVPHLDRMRWTPLDESGRPMLAAIPGDDLPAEVVIGWADYWTRTGAQDDPFFAPWLALAQFADDEFLEEFTTRADALRARVGAKEHPLSPVVGALLDGLPPQSRRELAGRYQALLSTVDPPDGVPGDAKNGERKPAEKSAETDLLSAEALRGRLNGPGGPYALARSRRLELAPPQLAERLAASRTEGEQIAAREPPKPSSAMSVSEGKPTDLPVHIRGSHLQLAPEPTPRGALSIIDSLVHPLEIPEGASGRLELARWMLQPEHPLTARVIVNRLWLGLFGEGLVRTPSNFGIRGDRPSHPELLDRLARDLIQGGWSTKSMIRRIVLTETWRQASDHNATAAAIDPSNRLLWRQNRRRLEAELVRDALLAVSDRLDPTVAGTLLSTANRGYVTNDQSKNQARYDVPRRSLYLPVIRNAMYELFSAFDYNDPSVPVDRRPATVVAHQALFFLNSPLVLDCARSLVEGELVSEDSDQDGSEEARIDRLTRRLYGRGATALQIERARGFLDRARELLADSPVPASHDTGDAMPEGEEPDLLPTPEGRAWQALVQAFLSSSEFIYFD